MCVARLRAKFHKEVHHQYLSNSRDIDVVFVRLRHTCIEHGRLGTQALQVPPKCVRLTSTVECLTGILCLV